MKTTRTRTLPLAVVAGFVLSLVAAGTSQGAADAQTLEQLRDIQLEVVQISEHAATLNAMTPHVGIYDLSAHEFELNRIKNRINAIGDLVPKIQSKADAPQWQKNIVDEVAALLAAMSAQTDAAIKLVSNATSPVDLNSNAYDARVTGIRHYAEHIDDLIALADTRTEIMRREQGKPSTQTPTS